MSDFPEPLRLDLTKENGCPLIQGDILSIGFAYRTRSAPVVPWVGSTRFNVGDYVEEPGSTNGRIYVTTVQGTTHATVQPTWSGTLGKRFTNGSAEFMRVRETRAVDTTGWGAKFNINAAADPGDDPYSGAPQVVGRISNGQAQVGFDPPVWLTDHVYGEGERVVPTVPNGWVYQCVDGGTSSAVAEPSPGTGEWPVILGTTVADGGVVWKCVGEDEGDDFRLTNVRVYLPASVTAALTEFGNGLYDIQITPPFDQTFTLAYGSVALWPSTLF